MKVIIDTCIWSLAYRRKHGTIDPHVKTLAELITDFRAQMLGPIRQEILSGIRSSDQFTQLKAKLNAFPDFLIESSDHEQAAEFFNYCRSKGVQGSNTDFLICALSCRSGMQVFTVDEDFQLFKKHLPIKLFTR